MKKIIILTGGAFIASTPLLSIISCSGLYKEKTTESREDLQVITQWLNVQNAQKLQYIEIDKYITNTWRIIDSNVARGLNQENIPTLMNGSVIRYILKSERVANQKVVYYITFKSTSTIDEAISGTVRFTSSNIYTETAHTDEERVSVIENTVIPIRNLNTRTYAQLKELETTRFVRFDLAAINSLGVNSNIPSNLLGTSVDYNLVDLFNIVNSKATFELTIRIVSGLVVRRYKYIMSSLDFIGSNATLEKNRILALVQKGLSSSYAYASTTFPSSYISYFDNNKTVKPFIDDDEPVRDTTSSYTRISYNDQNGIVKIKISITDSNNNTEEVIADVYGFLTDYKYVNDLYINVSNYFGTQITSTRTSGQLSGYTNIDLSASNGYTMLGLQNGNGVISTSNANLTYRIVSEGDGGTGKIFGIRIRIKRNASELDCYFNLLSSDYQP